MKTSHSRHFILLALAAVALMVIASWPLNAGTDSSTSKIKWYDYEAGWKKAKAENKHMFVDFTATWCGWCKKLERDTFSQKPVIDALNNDFVPVKVWEHSQDTLDIDGYKIATKDLIKKEFRVRGYPALWFVRADDGVRIGPAGGYVDAQRFLQVLDIVKNYRYDSTRTETGEKIEGSEKLGKK